VRVSAKQAGRKMGGGERQGKCEKNKNFWPGQKENVRKNRCGTRKDESGGGGGKERGGWRRKKSSRWAIEKTHRRKKKRQKKKKKKNKEDPQGGRVVMSSRDWGKRGEAEKGKVYYKIATETLQPRREEKET